MTLMQTTTGAQKVVDVAHFMGIPTDQGWCAGNESALILDVWNSMASGLPIDEQRAERESERIDKAQKQKAKLGSEGSGAGSDADPNDIKQCGAEDSDDSDYGESD